MYQIDKGVPTPGKEIKYPFARMDVGDSFFIPGGNSSSRGGIYQSARNAGVKVSMRQVEESGVKGVRVWRVA